MSEEQIFQAALDLPDHSNRAGYLDEVCGDNAELRRQVEELLAAHERTGEFLDEPAAAQMAAGTQPPKDQTVSLSAEGADAMADNKKTNSTPSDDDADDLKFLSPPTRPDSLGRLGHYEMLQVLGRGGFGIVFRAFDDMLQRVVAVKVMAPQIATLSPARKRFVREAQSSAKVRHENVVHIYEVGEQPLPYLVMEFVPGETLQQKLDRCGPLDVPEILRIGRQIAEGLAAAHASELIHRDIKPGNILLEGGSHKAKITDFGLARAADDASISQSGIVAGTPMFMAPEQALGHHIDQRADLFSLGSVLYQMVSGRPPFRAPSALAVLKRVAEEPPRPIAEIIPETPDWLCGIIAKLHAKNPADRFQSAREVADLLADCEAKLKAKQAVKNVLPAATRGEGRGASRRTKWLAAVAVLLLPLIALAVGVTEFAGVTHLFRGQQPTPSVIEPGVVRDPPIEVVKKETPALATGRFALAFDGEKSLVRIPSLKIAEDHALTVETWAVLEDPVDQRKNFDILCNSGSAGFALCSPPALHGGDGSRLGFVMFSEKTHGYARAWEKQSVPRHQLIHFAGVYDGKAEIRFYINGQFQSRSPIQSVRPGKRSLTVGGNGGDADNGSKFLGRINEVRISKVARYDSDFTPAKRWEPDTDTIALYHFDEGKGDVLKDSSGNGHHGKIIGAEWVKADGTPNKDSKQETPPPGPLTVSIAQKFEGHTGAVRSVALSGDSKHVVTGSADGTAVLWEASSGKMLQTFKGHTGAVTSVALSGDAKRVLTGSQDNTAILWEVGSGNKIQTFQGGHTDHIWGVALSGDGKHAITASSDRTAVLWEVASGMKIHTFLGHTSYIYGLALSGDGKHVVTASADRTAILWEVASGKDLQIFQGHSNVVNSVALSGDGQHVLTGSEDGTAILWEAASGKKLHTFQGHTGKIHGVALSRDAKHVLTAAADNTAVLWEAVSGKKLQTIRGHTGGLYSVALSGDGKYVLTGSSDNTAILWEIKPALWEIKPAPPISSRPPTFKNSIGMEFVIVPKGKSWLGGGKDKLGDNEVVIPADFYLGKFEVTQEEWQKVMGENPSHFSRTGAGSEAVKDISDADLKRFPVENVSWNQCQSFVAKLNGLEKEAGWVYRLPKEVEWEYACRGGPMADQRDSAFDFYFATPANEISDDQANFLAGSMSRTRKVGGYKPNRLGLYDMHGNLWEMCDDTENDGGGAKQSVARGGSFRNPANTAPAARPETLGSTRPDWARGFRLARVQSGAPAPEAKTPPAPVAPFTDADVKRIAALPAAEQVEEVRKELMRRNPGFDGKMDTKVADGVVTEFKIVTDNVTDIAPIRVWSALRVLTLAGSSPNKGLLADLTPLKGMNLAGLMTLDLSNTQVTDAGMVYFKDCKDLRELNLFRTQVGDAGLAHFKDCKNLTMLHLAGTRANDAAMVHFRDCKNLWYLNLINTKVSDAGLVHLKGMPLRKLRIYYTGITDLTPLQGLPLEDIALTPKNIIRGLDILRNMKSLKTIGIPGEQAWPAAEFWQRYDKGEFGTASAPTVHDTWLKAVALLPLDQHAAALPAKLKERLAGFDDAFLRAIPAMAADRQTIMAEAWLKERKPAFAGFEDAWLKAIPAMPADTQLVLVAAWLRECNTGFDGEVAHKIEGGVVTSLEVPSPLVHDLRPLGALTGLRSLTCLNPVGYDNKAESDAAVLRSLTKLENINGKPVAQFWKEVEARPAEFKEWLQLVATLNANQKVAAVAAKLKERNPGFDGNVAHRIEDGAVTQLTFKGENVTDLSPVRALVGLKDLKYSSGPLSDLSPLKGMPLTGLSLQACLQVRNLEPLKGMPLTTLELWRCRQVQDLEPLKGMPLTSLNLYQTQVQNLSPLKGMQLTFLHLMGSRVQNLEPLKGMPLTHLSLDRCTQVRDLEPLKGMPLTLLHLSETKVRDLEPLKGMPLTTLYLDRTKVQDLELLKGMPLKKLSCYGINVTDLTPLQGMELEDILLTTKNITKGLDILRDMKSLKTIGVGTTGTQAWPAAEFWERYDKGEFTK